MTYPSASQDASKNIVLIGGPMTMDDGSTLDSRQPIEGDPATQVILRSLATSRLWWNTASSLVTPILETAGPEAFALILGPRSVVEIDSAGQQKRTRLGGVLRGGVGSVSIVRIFPENDELPEGLATELPEGYDKVTELRNWNGESLGAIGVNVGESGPRWRFLDGMNLESAFYHEHKSGEVEDGGLAEKIGATAILNTEPERAYLALNNLVVNNTVLVLPHTFAIDERLKSYTGSVQRVKVEPVEPWDPAAPPDPLNYTHPVPTRAHFEVTGLVQDREWRDPSDLEAARSLLQARYDLKIGIWDLAGNPVLRSALLAERQTATPPNQAAPVPPAAAERADAVVRAKLDQRALVRNIMNSFLPLRDQGWQEVRHPNELALPFTELLPVPKAGHPSPLWFTLVVNKRHTKVTVGTLSLDNNIDLRTRLKEMRVELEETAGPATVDLDNSLPTIWRADSGWGDEVNWAARAHELASCTRQWVKLFESLADDYYDVLGLETVQTGLGTKIHLRYERHPTTLCGYAESTLGNRTKRLWKIPGEADCHKCITAISR